MPVWYEEHNISHRLGHPFVHPGGPCVVSEPAASRRQTVGQFQEQATAAWRQLVDTVQQGLQEQAQYGTSQQWEDLGDPQQGSAATLQQQQQQQQPGLDLSGLAVPPLARKRLTGPVLLVPQPDPPPPSLTAKQAADAARAAALAAQPEVGGVLEALVVPEGCLLLQSWQESAAAREPPGEVATRNDGPGVCTPAGAAAAVGGGGSTTAAAAAAAAAVVGFDEVLQPCSEVVVTLSVMDTSRRLTVVQQEIQALGSNTLAEVCDVIQCPTDLLAAGLGSHNPAAYFYIDKTFYDDTRSVPAAECAAAVEQWVNRLGLAGPRILLQHFEPPEDAIPVLQQLQQLLADMQSRETQQQQQQQEVEAAAELGIEQAQQQLEEQEPPEADHHHQQQQQQQRRDMQAVSLRDLALQAANRPMALYSHQGLCEHAVVITDVRLLHAADPSCRSSYPRTVFQASLGKRLHCGVCKRRGASALMLDHPETPEAVVVLCRLCCGLFDVQQHPEAKLIELEPM